MLIAPAHPPEKTLAEFLLGNLPDSQCEQVEQHLEACPECTELALRLTARDDLTELIKAAALSPAVTAELSKSAAVSTSKWSFETFSTLDSVNLSANGLTAQYIYNPSQPAKAPPEIPPGLREHPRYRLLRCIGQGGMGVVWLAEHQLMHRHVVLKSVRAELLAKPQAIERFGREVQAISRLNHPNIVAAYDAELIDDCLYLVIEFVEGETLGEMVKRGPLAIEDACAFIAAAARGLEHAHNAGIVHRDIKPNNIIRSVSGQVKVLDFGLAGLAEIEEGPTAANLVMGTPDYISPEQASHPSQVDARADIYSLGCTLYHLLTGHVPFTGTAALVKIDAHRHQAIERPEAIPEYLWKVVSRMLAKQPEDRFHSASEVAELLGNLERLKHTPRSFARVLTINWRYTTLAVLLLCVLMSFTAYRQLGNQMELARSNDRSSLADALIEQTPFDDTAIKIASQLKPQTHNQLMVRHQSPVSSVAWSHDGDRLFSAGYDGTLRETDVISQKTLRVFDLGNQVQIRDMAIADDKEVWLSTTTGIVKCSLAALPGATNHEELLVQHGTSDDYLVKSRGLTALALAPSSDRIAWGDINGLLSLWDKQRQTAMHQVSLGNVAIYEIVWSASGEHVLAAGDFGIAMVNAADGKLVWHFPRVTAGATRAIFSSDGQQIYTSHWGGKVEILDANRGFLHRVFESDHGDTSFGNVLFLGGDSQQVITTASDSTVKVWDANSGQLLNQLSGHGVRTLTCSVNSKGWLASGAEDGTVRLWKLGEHELPELKPQPQLGHDDVQVLIDGEATELRSWLLRLPADYGVVELNRISGRDDARYQAIGWRGMADPSYTIGIDLPLSTAEYMNSIATVSWKIRSQFPLVAPDSSISENVNVTYLRRPTVASNTLDQQVSRETLTSFVNGSRQAKLRPVSLMLMAPDSLPIDNTRKYQANLQASSDIQWDAAVELTAAELHEFMEKTRDCEYRPLFIQGFGAGPARRYACVTVANRASSNWQVDIAIPSSRWPALYQRRIDQGLRPRSLTSQMVGDEMLMTVLWLDKSETEVP